MFKHNSNRVKIIIKPGIELGTLLKSEEAGVLKR